MTGAAYLESLIWKIVDNPAGVGDRRETRGGQVDFPEFPGLASDTHGPHDRFLSDDVPLCWYCLSEGGQTMSLSPFPIQTLDSRNGKGIPETLSGFPCNGV